MGPAPDIKYTPHGVCHVYVWYLLWGLMCFPFAFSFLFLYPGTIKRKNPEKLKADVECLPTMGTGQVFIGLQEEDTEKRFHLNFCYGGCL